MKMLNKNFTSSNKPMTYYPILKRNKSMMRQELLAIILIKNRFKRPMNISGHATKRSRRWTLRTLRKSIGMEIWREKI